MLDEQVTDQVVEQVEVDYKALYEASKVELEKIRAKKEELLAETKAAKKAKEQEQQEAIRLANEKAQKDGEFEKLWQTAEQQRKALEEQLQNERTAYKSEKIQSHAMKLAVELADGDASSATLLSKFVQETISRMADEKGSLDENVLVAVKKEFQNNAVYAPLLSGSKAKGGGALGGGNSVAQNNVVDRKTFDTMDPVKQRDFVINKKGTITD